MIDLGELHRLIEHLYSSSGNRSGWRLLYSPRHVMLNADIAFVGLNPGGDAVTSGHGELAMDTGSAYCDEAWNGLPAGEHPLQRQVRALFEKLDVPPHDVLAGNLVPWRSRSWNTLADRRAALDFGCHIWSDIFENVQPRLVITMGGNASFHVARLLKVNQLDEFPVNWGKVVAKRGKNDTQTLICLPHLSRYQIITRPQSQQALATTFGAFWLH